MQLFVLDREFETAASFLADIHLVKMCLETAQILSGVMIRKQFVLPADFPRGYAINHPVILAIQTPEQINWVAGYNVALQHEFSYRFGKNHAYSPLSCRYYEFLHFPGSAANCNGLARVFRGFYTPEEDLILAHREYYCFRMDNLVRPPAWSRRPVPPWLTGKIQ